MSELTPNPRVLPTANLQGAAALTPSTPEASTPEVDRVTLWAYLKRAATEVPTKLNKALAEASLEAGNTAGEITSNSANELGTDLLGGNKVRFLLKVYLSLKELEERLRHHAAESRSRFVRWAADKSAALVGFVATLFTPPEIKAAQPIPTAEVLHRKRSRLKGSLMPSEAESESKQSGESPAPGESDSPEKSAREAKESEATVFLHAGLHLAEQRREEKKKNKLSAEKEQRAREAQLAVQEEQLLALALIDGVAGPEVYELLASLRQPYASPSTVRDGIEATNRKDQTDLLRRFEEFVVGLRVAMQRPEASGT